MRISRIFYFGFALILVGVLVLSIQQQTESVSNERCVTLQFEKYDDTINLVTNQGKKQLNGIDNYESFQKAELRDANFTSPNSFQLLWWNHDSRTEANSFAYLDRYRFSDGKVEEKRRVLTDTNAGLGNTEYLVKSRERFMVRELIGRTGIYSTEFYYPNEKSHYR